MTRCTNPLDPIDIEALAAGSEPVVMAEAGRHAASCPSCQDAVRQAVSFEGQLLAAGAGLLQPSGSLADRVLRIRPFSRRERLSFAVWRAPLLLLGGLTAAGLTMVTGPAGAREQIGLAAAAFGSLAALARAAGKWALDFSRLAPAGLEAFSGLAPSSFGLAALLLLLPAGFALRAVLVRANARR